MNVLLMGYSEVPYDGYSQKYFGSKNLKRYVFHRYDAYL